MRCYNSCRHMRQGHTDGFGANIKTEQRTMWWLDRLAKLRDG